MLRWIIAALIGPLLAMAAVAAAARAQDKPAEPKPPADKPAAQADPAKSRADEKALRDALKTLAKALQDGDGERIKQVLYAAEPIEQKMVDAMAAMAVEIAQLHKASVKAFGEEQAKGLTGDVAAEMGRIDAAEVAVDGDTATVRYKESPPDPAAGKEPPKEAPPPAPPMVLKRVSGVWRVPMAELSKGSTPEEIEQRLSDLAAQTKIIKELTAEVAQGKHKSAEKAAEAWQSKMMQALTPSRQSEGEKAKESEKPSTPADEPADQSR
jgi:hypothetical protein